MFFKILKRDLKIKNAMNIVLFVLITLAAMLLASSSNFMYSTTTAVSSFIRDSKIADCNILIPNTTENNAQIEKWAEGEKGIQARYSTTLVQLAGSDIIEPKERKKISGNTILLLSTVPEDVNLVFNGENERFTLQSGEVGLPVSIKNKTGLKLGDELSFDIEGVRHTFVIATFFKDALMGSELFTFKRLLVSQQDFDLVKQNLPQEQLLKFWSIIGQGDITASLSKSNIYSTFEINKELVKMSFMTDQISAAILFVVSLFLMFIAFLTLRFTIISSIQRDYKEIGVMKAIGFADGSIRKLYLTKYLGISIISGAVGLGISVPLTNMMSVKVSDYIIVPSGVANIMIAVASTVVLVAMTLLFCSLCMVKINKASAIDAIRHGHNGETFRASRKINLHKRKSLPAPLFLAISDVLNGLKGYTTLICTFVLSTAIILIPINLANTIVTPKFITYLGVTEADFYTKGEASTRPIKDIQNDMHKLEQKLRDHHFDVTLSVDYTLNTKYVSDDGKDSFRLMGMKTELPSERYPYLEGVAPKLANEIAITSIIADKYNKHIGDNIKFEMDGKEQSFLISGIIQTITNQGYMVKLADDYKPLTAAGYQLNGNIHASDKEKPQIIEKMQQQFGDMGFKSAMDIIGDTTGGFVGQLKLIIVVLIVIVSLITFFITVLFVRLLMTKEIQGIAIMKSLGFSNGDIKLWQMLRILILLLASIVIGVFVANVLGEGLISKLFRMFGVTQMKFIIIPLQVYVLCPLLILIVVLLAVYVSCNNVKRIQVWNIHAE
ncbi:FtsX-like permease family protein [Paenibacillus sp. NPDC056722]|uniref:ABC transporter permease n=1 Tax=Paenibacillus sp. NPDC056722 TaxID=3345924 RepID=UPI00367F3E06